MTATTTTTGVLAIATAPLMSSSHWAQGTITWDEFTAWAEDPADHKDCGGYVLGTLTGGKRGKGTVIDRHALTLDADEARPDLPTRVAELGVRALVHSTFKSTPEHPRYRIILPLDRPVTPDEFRAITGAMIGRLGAAEFDDTCTQPERLMLRPSAADPGNYEYQVIDGPPLAADPVLAAIPAPAPAPAPAPTLPSAPAPLSSADESRAAVYVRGSVPGALSDLATTAAMPEGARDARGRGWESGTAKGGGLLAAHARRLVELSNSAPSTYPLGQARTDYLAAAPAGHETTFAGHWDSAVKFIGAKVATIPERTAPRPSLADEFGTATARPAPTPATAAEPVAEQDPAPTPDRFAPLDWGEVLDGPEPEEDWVLWPLAERGQSVSLYSAPKVGKSLLLLDMLTRACAGRWVLGRHPAAPIRVLYLDAENTRKDLRKRLGDMHADPATLDRLVYLSFPPLAPLDTARGALELVALVDEHRPDLVVIDTVSRFIDGPENDADTWLNIYRLALAPLKAREVAVIRLDHTGKDTERGERGSSAKNGDVDASYQLTYDKARRTRTLVRKLTRTGNGPERLVLNVLERPLRHEPASPLDVSADPASHLVRKLDELGADPDIGFKLAGPLLRDNGHGFSNDLLRDALRLRKAREGDLGGDLGTPSRSPERSPSEGDLGLRSPQHETPGQRVTLGERSPEVTSSSDPSDPTSPLPIGEVVRSPSQGRRSPALCESCREPLPAAVIADGFTTHPACEEVAR